MVANKEYVFSLLEDFVDNDVEQILIPSSEYEYGSCPLPAIGMNAKGEIRDIDDTVGYSITRGATKVVIIPTQEDFVIKLNITGTYLTERECETLGYEYPHIDRISEQNILDEEIAMYNDMPIELQGFIKPNIFVGYFNNIPVYIQEKIRNSYENSEETSKERFLNERAERLTEISSLQAMIKPTGWRSSLFPSPFINDMLNYFGEEKTKSILTQLCDAAVYDLNYGNFGYDMEDKPCLFDIGGFEESEFFQRDEQYYNTVEELTLLS